MAAGTATAPASSSAITLRGRDTTLADVVSVARSGVLVAIGEEARSRLVAARAVVDRLALAGTPVYGVTTALGANTGAAIPASELAACQKRAVLARAVGLGPPFPRDAVRAMMF